MNHQQAIEYFFDRIRLQILTALANRKVCEDLHLMGKLEIFEKNRKETIQKDSCASKLCLLHFILILVLAEQILSSR